MEKFPQKYPKKLDVLGIEWKVRYFDQRKDIDKCERYVGMSHHDKGEICILTNTRPEKIVLETLFHEVCHIITMQMQLNHVKPEEAFVSVMSVALSDFLFRNKLLKFDEKAGKY